MAGLSLAKALGHGYAYVQHGIDRAIAWTFRKMKQAGGAAGPGAPALPAGPSTPRSSGKYLRGAASVAKRSLLFLGSVGDAYYRKYEELKGKARDRREEGRAPEEPPARQRQG